MKELLKALCSADGVGTVGSVGDVIEQNLSDYTDAVYRDNLGNITAIRRCGCADAPLVMLEAHVDEIGFIVTHVDDSGFVHVSNVGGVDRRVLAATEVTVLTHPRLNGVFCSTPPHLASEGNKVSPIDEMGIDVGLSAEDAKRLIVPGTKVSFRPNFKELNSTLVSSKALDDRAGCAAVIKAMQALNEETLAVDVAAVFSTREEIGGAGALTAAYANTPNAAIVTDVSFAYTPDATEHLCGKLGKGPMLGISPGLDCQLVSLMEQTAQTYEIPLQQEVMGGDTGTDADHILCSKSGVPTALLSIPQRYMHTPVEVVDVRDVEAVAELMAKTVKEYGNHG